jgi:hypothetical protein
MYTEEMAKAFHSVSAPEGFSIDLYDAEEWITVVVDPNSLVNKTDEELKDIVDYINGVKLALESQGAIVLVARDAIGE